MTGLVTHDHGSAAKASIPAELIELARLSSDDALKRLSTSAGGLSEAEARVRLQRYGPNAVAQDPRRSVVAQTLIIHIIRTNRTPFIESKASTPLMFTSLIICTIGVWLPYSPFARALGFTPLPALYWPIGAALLIGYLALTHGMKRWFHRRFGID